MCVERDRASGGRGKGYTRWKEKGGLLSGSKFKVEAWRISRAARWKEWDQKLLNQKNYVPCEQKTFRNLLRKVLRKRKKKNKTKQGGCPGMRWGWSGHWSIHAFFKYCHRFRILSQVQWKATGVTETKSLKTVLPLPGNICIYLTWSSSTRGLTGETNELEKYSHTSTKLIKGQLWKQSQNIKPEARPQHRHYWWGRCHFFT